MKAKNTKTNIPEGWKMTTLGEVAEIVMGQSPSGESYNKKNDGLPFYQGITEFGDKYVNIKTFTSQPIKIIEPNSILFSVRAPVGKVNFIKHKSCIGRGNAGIKMKNGEQDFLYFLLKKNEKAFLNNATGTVFDSISGVQLRNFDILIPEYQEEQHAIAAVLSSFDDKIELLREQNKTLEAIAQALYKRWFVDFEFPAAEPNLLQLPSFQGGVPEGRGGINNSCPKGGAASDRIINNKSALKTFRKQLRNSLTAAEAKLWTHLQNKQLNGRKFRRQFSIDNYILDFYCPSEKLAIELDGEVHNIETQAKYDNERDLFLSYYGIKVLRFENKVVFENIDYLLECIKKEFGRDTASAATTPPFGHPSLKGGELKGYKSSGGKMINSELGEIPAGWRVGTIEDLIDILSGFAFSSLDFSKYGKYKLVTIKNVQDRYFNPNTKDNLTKFPKKMPDHCKLNSGDILLSLTGNVGRICFVNGEGYLLNQRVAKLRAKNACDYAFTYLLFLQDLIFSLLQNIASGTAQQNLSPIKIKKICIIIADRTTLDRFGEVANKLIQKINDNNSQIQTLSSIRDALLPKLISGKIRVSTTPPFGHPSLEEEELEDK